MAKTKKPQPTVTVTDWSVTVARLTDDGVYQGIDTIPADKLTDAHIQVPKDCDLRPGAYVWVAEAGHFWPLKKKVIK